MGQVNLSDIHDYIESLLQDERGEDGTYETDAIEVSIQDLEEWRDVLATALGRLPQL